MSIIANTKIPAPKIDVKRFGEIFFFSVFGLWRCWWHLSWGRFHRHFSALVAPNPHEMVESLKI